MNYFIHNTFAIHYKSATFFLDNAISTEEGRFYNLLSSILFCALSLEAYLNHQGCIEIDEEWNKWDSEEKPNIKQKIKKLSEINKLELDFNTGPFSIIEPLFRFRTLVVHGRTETIKKNIKNPPNNSNGALKNLSSDIEKFCTIKNAQNISKYTKEIIEYINEMSKHKIAKSRLWSLGHGSFRVKIT